MNPSEEFNHIVKNERPLHVAFTRKDKGNQYKRQPNSKTEGSQRHFYKEIQRIFDFCDDVDFDPISGHMLCDDLHH